MASLGYTDEQGRARETDVSVQGRIEGFSAPTALRELVIDSARDLIWNADVQVADLLHLYAGRYAGHPIADFDFGDLRVSGPQGMIDIQVGAGDVVFEQAPQPFGIQAAGTVKVTLLGAGATLTTLPGSGILGGGVR